MPRDLFTDVVDPSIRIGTRPWYSVPLSIVSHLTVLGILVAAPLMAARSLPPVGRVLVFTASVAIPEPPPQPVTVPRAETVQPGAAVVDGPVVPMPQTSLPESSSAGALALPPPSLADQVTSTVPSFGPAAVSTLGAPPRHDENRVLPVGGAVGAPVKVKGEAPVYPAAARAARAQGVVILEAIIAKDGTVRDVRVVKSVPLLDHAAIEAVRGWRYTQPTLNGVPVDVSMTVKVAFTLN